MRPRDPRLFLADIDTAVGRILDYTAGGEAEFRASTLIQDAVVRQLEIIGEATRNLDDHLLSQEPSIPWRKVVGMRHMLVHDYYQVDVGVVWDTVSSDLVELRAAVQRLSRTLEEPLTERAAKPLLDHPNSGRPDTEDGP